MKKLPPPKNFRLTLVKCCGTCRHVILDNGVICDRSPDTVLCNPEDHYQFVCDWKQQRLKREQ